ncbi:hypothetical protein [Methylomonas koyamae]|uniref:hypothetical protein n=1 Tax=Methylomonas koyamae TaxID=702114 RepID=UPI0006D2AA88|nr:hypothetical protein [Methylomonas koyamae]BBL60204.1 hypothetical protein MKFW12EY_38170 [Methylomonas koyamae]
MCKRLLILNIVVLIGSQTVWADWDPELEAKAAAERAAAQRAEQARQQQAQHMLDAAKAKAEREVMNGKRKALGAAVQEKSDAEVDRLYQARTRQNQQEAERLSAEARAALSSGQGAAAVKQVTGKTLQELEKKYGQ